MILHQTIARATLTNGRKMEATATKLSGHNTWRWSVLILPNTSTGEPEIHRADSRDEVLDIFTEILRNDVLDLP